MCLCAYESHFSPSQDIIGEGNGTPLQYSCLENPMDGGAWWAAVHGVAKSRTQLSDFFHFSLSCIGEGNGNPLQCSCLENPRDGGAWWAAVHGVTQSQTRLKRLSSSSSRIFYLSLTLGGEREVQVGGTYVNLWLIPVNVWQRPTQYYKAIILQLKINFFKNFKFLTGI